MIEKAQKFYSNGKYKQAQEICLKILENEPANDDAARLIALVMLKTGHIATGIEFLKVALTYAPNKSENNVAMGLYSRKLNKTPEAINAFTKAYQQDPQNVQTLINLGDIQVLNDNWPEAIVYYAQAINIDPTNHTLNQAFANNLKNCTFKKISDMQKQAIESVFLDESINIRSMFYPWLQIINEHPDFEPLAKSIKQQDFDLNVLPPMINSIFFTKGIQRLRQTPPLLEKLLTNIRRELLNRFIDDHNINLNNYYLFLYALSMHCWTNEYSFYYTEDEIEHVTTLKNYLNNETIKWNADKHIIPLLYLYSCYAPVNTINKIDKRALKLKKQAPNDFNIFMKLQIVQPLEEEKIKKTIPQFTDISDEISVIVKKQYEENPYPRWIEPILVDDKNIDYTRYNILFAGCGTGFQVSGFAQQFPNSTFTAIDLSASSLAYAIYQTKTRLPALFKKIRFGLGDILKLDELSDTYDRIYCTGVLHHMNDPEAGLSILKKILRPNGTMQIALYSEIARKDIVAARDYIRKKGYKNTNDDIRRFRRNMINLSLHENASEFVGTLVKMADFYTLSDCRDLVFHVQEHRYTIPQILDILDRHDLEFISFNIREQKTINHFKKIYTNPNDIDNPLKWHEYEQKFPYSFIGMYDFNVRIKN